MAAQRGAHPVPGPLAEQVPDRDQTPRRVGRPVRRRPQVMSAAGRPGALGNRAVRTREDARMTTSARVRRHGPAVGEPPVLADPRRWGSLVGLAGGLTFVGSYSPALGPVVSTAAWAAGLALALAALVAHYVRPVALGPLDRPRPLGLAVYGVCVVAEVVLIAAGSGALAAAGRSELRPALVATVVGLHFIPFAWAFGERMFLPLGAAVAALGAAGLLTGGLLDVPRAAETVAVLAGLVLLATGALHARGQFTRPAVAGSAP